MTESDEDKYQSLLQTIEGLNFNDGTYLQLCDSLKKIKESLEKVTVNDISVNIVFEIRDDFYQIFVKQQECIKLGDKQIDYLIYSIKSKIYLPEYKNFHFKKEDCEGVEHIRKYLTHAENIVVNYTFDNKDLNFSLAFGDLDELCRYYTVKSIKRCAKCNTDDDDECKINHTCNSGMALFLLFNIVKR
jgi:hypothetical protein